MASAAPLAVATAARKNYVPFVRVLARSLAAHHSDVPLVLGLTDEVEDRFDPSAEPFELLPIAELPVPDLHGFLARYDAREATIAVKPYLLQSVLDRGAETVVYIDVDVLVLEELTGLFEAAAAHAITLLPHLLEPLEAPDRRDRELNILQSGVFNGGVLGVRDCPEGRRFLAWWQARLYEHCRHSIAEGMHYDQRWLDLVPAFFEDVHVFRDPTVNIAHWNLPDRDPATYRLFHFSGYDPDRPTNVTQYSNRLTMADRGIPAALFARYHRALLDAGWNEARDWPYAFSNERRDGR
jgi:hypothetical protein